MAKKKPHKSKPGGPKKAAGALADDTVELHVPQKVWDLVGGLDKKVFKQLVRAVFDHDELFGVNKVNVVVDQAAVSDDDRPPGGFYKICDGP